MNRPYNHHIKFSVELPQLSGKELEGQLSTFSDSGRSLAGLGAGGLGALLGLGIGGLTASKGKRIRNALIGAGIGGAAGGLGGYYLSPHIKPINFNYLDTDTIKRTLGISHGTPESKSRAVSLAEMLGAFGNPQLIGSILDDKHIR